MIRFKAPPMWSDEDKLQHYALLLLKASLVIAMAIMLIRGDWERFLFSGLALLLAFLPELIESRIKIILPVEFGLVLVLFNYLSWFAGEALNAYDRFWWWDVMLHTSSGLILGFAAFLVIYTSIIRHEMKISARLVMVFIFIVGIGFGALWELFEFTIDSLFILNMQRRETGVLDTMYDLLVDGSGALIMGYIGARYIRKQKVWFVGSWIKDFFKYNPQLLFGKNHGKR